MKVIEEIPSLPDSTEADYERKFSALVRLIRRGQGRFVLALVDFDLPSLRQETLLRLRKECDDINLVIAELSPLPPDAPKSYSVLDQLADRVRFLSPDKPPDALVILGLETLFPQALATDETRITKELVEALQPLNYGRNTLARMFPCPVILCLPPRAMGILVRSAPDIVSWKSAAFSFQSDRDAARAKIEQAASAKMNWWTRQQLRRTDRKTLEEEVAQLETLIADAHESSSDNETIARLNLRLGWIAVALDNRLRARAAFDETLKHTADTSLKKAATRGQNAARRIKLPVGVSSERAAELRKLFRGATSLTEADNLYGREDELQQIVSQVSAVGTRFFTIWGETGCGKSSLARAGLVPALTEQKQFLPVVVRQWNDPLNNIRQALAQAAPDIDLSELPTLLGCVQHIAARTGKTVVIVCDQFEQFFTSHPLLGERRAVIEEIGACYNAFPVPCKFVFVIRTDELGRMAEFDSEVTEPLAQAKRFYLRLFSDEDAARVLRQLSKQANLEWTEGLIQAVVNDLSRDGRVRPVEMQLVGAALAISGINTETDYGPADRAEGLLRDYLQLTLWDLRQSKRDETAMKRILLALVSESNTRHALTHREIKERTGRLRGTILSRLVKAHLVSRIDEPDSSAPRYELTHDTLVEKVLQLTRSLQDKKRQADRTLKRALEDLKATPRHTIGLHAAWLVWNHADRREMKNPKVPSLLLRSFGWGITKWIVVPIVGLILTLYVVQNSFGHVTLERDFADRVVVRRGLPWLGFLPWIGKDIVLDTGLTTDQFMRGQQGQVQDIINWEWKNLSSGTLIEPNLVNNLSSLLAQGELWCQAGKIERGLEMLLTVLKNSDYYLEKEASVLGQVAQAAPAQALPHLLLALKGSDYKVQRAVASALGQVAQADKTLAPQILPELLAVLKDKVEGVTDSAAHALGQVVQADPSLTEQALPHLFLALKDSDYKVRETVASVLGQIAQADSTLAPQILPELLAALKDEDMESVTNSAAHALGQVARADKTLAPQILPPLLSALKTLVNRQRQEEAKATRGLEDFKADQRMVTALGWVVHAAPVQNLSPTLATLKDRDHYMRESVASALGQVAQADKNLAPQILPELLAAFKERDDGVAAALGQVAQADKNLASQILPPLLAVLKDKKSLMRDGVAVALGQVVQADKTLAPQVLPELLAALKDRGMSSLKAHVLGQVALADKTLAPQILPPLLAVLKEDCDYGCARVVVALVQVAQVDKTLARQILPKLPVALKKDSRVEERDEEDLAAALGQVVQEDKLFAHVLFLDLLIVLKKDMVYRHRRWVITVLGKVAQVNAQTKEMAIQSLISGDEIVRSGLAESLPDIFVADAENEAKNGRDPLQFLLAHLEGGQSYLPQGNANTYAVYRNLLVTAMAKWLVSDKPEAKATQAALRQRLEQMRASDKRLHLRIAAWNALAQAAELKNKTTEP